MSSRNWYSIQNKADAPTEISIHDEIGLYGISAKAFLADLKNVTASEIHLSVHSPGGDVLDGWAMYNALQNHPAKVTAKVEGLAASMASVILMAADRVEMPENSFLMIHNPWTGVVGDAQDMRDTADTLEKIQNGIVSAYASRTKMPREDVEDLMAHSTYISAEEAVEWGFADEVTKSFKAAALAPQWKARLPENFPTGLVFGSPEPEIETKPEPTAKSEPTPQTPTPQNTMSEPQAPEPKVSIKDALAADKPRRDEIKAIGEKFHLDPKDINAAIEDGVEVETFRSSVIDNFKPEAFTVSNANENAKYNATENLGDKAAERYSVFKAIKEIHNGGNLSGLEREVQDELAKRYRAATGDVPSGVLIPGEWLNAHASQIRNAATVGTGTSGGNTVDEEMQGLTDYLKDYSILPTVGATMFRDAVGNLEFPRSTAGYSGTWDAETDTISNADATFAANLTLSPKRVGAGTAVSKQLLAQSSVDFEGWVRGELLYAIATAVDRAAITGTGSNDQPTGLLNASGTGSYTWVTGTSAWENVIAQWKVLRAANCPMRSVNWLSDENVRADWSGTPKVSGASAFIIEQAGSAMQSSVYGFPFYDHTDVTTNKVILGDFSALMVAMWGGIELIVDPYSKKTSGQVELYAQTFADVGVRQPACFVIGNDGTDHAGAIA